MRLWLPLSLLLCISTAISQKRKKQHDAPGPEWKLTHSTYTREDAPCAPLSLFMRVTGFLEMKADINFPVRPECL